MSVPASAPDGGIGRVGAAGGAGNSRERERERARGDDRSRDRSRYGILLIVPILFYSNLF
jgi:hypothetical protein